MHQDYYMDNIMPDSFANRQATGLAAGKTGTGELL